MAMFNVVRTLFGAGVLGLPLATSQAGMVLGTFLNIGVGALLIHSYLTLLNSLNEVCRRLRIPHISYRYGFRMAVLSGPPILNCVGESGPVLVATFMILSQLGICTVFVVFTGDSLRDICDWSDIKPALLCLLPFYLILQYFMKTLKIVSYVSLIGNFLNLAAMALIAYHYFNDDQSGDHMLYTFDALPLFFAFGNYMFNMSAVGVILAIDRALPNPKVLTKRFGVITLGFSIPCIIGTVFGCLGYWAFGTMEENILRALPFDEMTTMAAMGLYLIAVAFAFPIQTYPAIQIILQIYKARFESGTAPKKVVRTVRHILRPIVVFAAFGIAYAVPFQGPIVAFVGNLCTTQLCLTFPALMELSLLYPDRYGKYNYRLVKNILIIFIGLMGFLVGMVLCGYLLYIRFLHLHTPVNEFS